VGFAAGGNVISAEVVAKMTRKRASVEMEFSHKMLTFPSASGGVSPRGGCKCEVIFAYFRGGQMLAGIPSSRSAIRSCENVNRGIFERVF
jgi:hypothetical protein